MPLSAPDLRAAKRLVVKIGSALLVDRNSGLRQGWLSALAMDVAEARVRGAAACVARLASRRPNSVCHGRTSGCEGLADAAWRPLFVALARG